MNMNVNRAERGWAGHFICSDKCQFRRNTLLESANARIVVSTVGAMDYQEKQKRVRKEIGCNRYYETMVFHVNEQDKDFSDIDVSREISFTSTWAISKEYDDNGANDMHEAVVDEMTERMWDGEDFNED